MNKIRRRTRRSWLYCSVATGVSLLLATNLNAQTTAPSAPNPDANSTAPKSAPAVTEPELIVVGVRKSIRSATQLKRGGQGVTEVLKAEDIGQLPERNIADALERLPGVAGNNDKGRSNQISIRGLGGGYTLTEVNGRSVASTYGTRWINLDIYPSETVGKATVYKTPSANQTEGGAGGTVDIYTFHPLDVGNYAAASVQGIYTPNAKQEVGQNGFGSRGSFVISHVSKDKHFGILFGGSTLKETIMIERFEPGTWANADFDGDGVGGDYGYGVHDANGKVAPANLYISNSPAADNNHRNSLYGAVQWKATDTLSFSADALYSKYDAASAYPFMNLNFYCDSNIQGATVDPNIGATKFHAAACIDVYSGASKERDSTYNLGGHMSWQVNGFDVQADLAYSSAPSTYEFPFTMASGYYSSDVTVDYTSGGDIPKVTIGGVNLKDPTGQKVTLAQYNYSSSTDVVRSAKLDVKHDLSFGWLDKVSVGVRYEDQKKVSTINNQDYAAPATGKPSVVSAPFPFQNLYADFNTPVQNKTWLYYDAWAALKSYGPQPTNLQDAGDLAASFNLTEATAAAYVRFDFAGQIAGIPIYGDFGTRVVDTALTTNGQSIPYSVVPTTITTTTGSGATITTDGVTISAKAGATLSPVTVKTHYTNILPSATAVLELTDTALLRASVAETMQRPNFIDLRASTNIAIGPVSLSSPVVGSSGNPFLKPIQIFQQDLSLEWYPSKGTYGAIAVFRKDFDSFYQSGVGAINPKDKIPVYLTQPLQNKKAGGAISGIEIGGTYELGALPGLLQHVSVYGNVTLIDIPLKVNYSLTPGLTSYYMPPFMNRSTQNFGAFYDDGKYTYVLNYYSQGKTSQYDGGHWFLRLPFNVLNASFVYRATPKLTLSISGNNLTNEHQNYGDIGESMAGSNPGRLVRSTIVGRSFFGGLRYQF